MSDTEPVAVMIWPFWKYAVGPTSASHPAIPFIRLSSAQRLFDKAVKDLPYCGVRMYRRTFLGKIETIKEHKP